MNTYVFQLLSSGFGEFTPLADNLLLALTDVVTEVHFKKNIFGRNVAGIINKFWYRNPVFYNSFLQWCNTIN